MAPVTLEGVVRKTAVYVHVNAVLTLQIRSVEQITGATRRSVNLRRSVYKFIPQCEKHYRDLRYKEQWAWASSSRPTRAKRSHAETQRLSSRKAHERLARQKLETGPAEK